MTSHAPSYRGYRFPPETISHAVWLYHRFGLSFRDTEDLLAQRGITGMYETIRSRPLFVNLTVPLLPAPVRGRRPPREVLQG